MRSLFGLVLFISLLASTSLASDTIHQAPDDFLKSWVEGPIRLGGQQELTLGPVDGTPMQLLQHTRVVPITGNLLSPESPSGVEAWRDCYNIIPRTDGPGLQVSLYRDGTWVEAGKLPDCVLSDVEWFDGALYFLMRPAKSLPTSTHLYRSQVTPSGSITPPALAALAPHGMILEKFAVTRDGLYGVGRVAGDERRRLISLRGVENHSPGWSDCGEVRIPTVGVWDITSRGNHLVLFSPSLRDIGICPAPRMGEVAQWERKHLDQGPWREVLCKTMDRLEAKSGIPPRIIHMFSLPQSAEVAGLRMGVVGKVQPRLRWRVANAATDVYSDWSRFTMEEYVPIGEAAQFVQYEIRPPLDDSPVGIREIALVLATNPDVSVAGDPLQLNGDPLFLQAQPDSGVGIHTNLPLPTQSNISSTLMAQSLMLKDSSSGPELDASESSSTKALATPMDAGRAILTDEDTLDGVPGEEPSGTQEPAGSEMGERTGENEPGGQKDNSGPVDSSQPDGQTGQGQSDLSTPMLVASTENTPESGPLSGQGGANPADPSSANSSNTPSETSGEGVPESSQAFSSSAAPIDGTGNQAVDSGVGSAETHGNSGGNEGNGNAGQNGSSVVPDSAGDATGQGDSATESGSSGAPAYGGTTDGPSSSAVAGNGKSTDGDDEGHGSNAKANGSETADSASPSEPVDGGTTDGPSSSAVAANGKSTDGDDEGRGSNAKANGSETADSVSPSEPVDGDTTDGPSSSAVAVNDESTDGDDEGRGSNAKADGSETGDSASPSEPVDGDTTNAPSNSAVDSNGESVRGDDSGQDSQTQVADGKKVVSGFSVLSQSHNGISGTDSSLSGGQFGLLTNLDSRGIGTSKPARGDEKQATHDTDTTLGKIAADYLIPFFLGLFVLLLVGTALQELRGGDSLMTPLLRPTLSSHKWEERKRAETAHANQLAAESIPATSPSGEAVILPVLPVLPEREKGKVEWRIAEPLPRPMAPATAFYHHGAVYVVDPHGTICHARLRADGSLCPWGVRVGRLPSRATKGFAAFVDPFIVCVSGDEISIAPIEGDAPGEWRLAGKLEGLHGVTAVVGMGNRLFLVGGGSKGNPFPAVRSVDIDAHGHLGALRCHPPLPLGITDGTLAGGGNQLYWIGGSSQGKVSRKVFSAQLGSDCQFEDWRTEPDLPWGQRHPTVEFWGGALWVVLNKPMGDESMVFKAGRNKAGNLLQWEATGQRLPEPVHSASLPFVGGRFMLVGGWIKSVGSVPRTEVLSWKPV